MSDVKYKFFDYGTKEIEYLSLADPVLGDAIARLGRVEREVIPDPFSALVYAIIGQLISTNSAKTVWIRCFHLFMGDFLNTNSDNCKYRVITCPI